MKPLNNFISSKVQTLCRLSVVGILVICCGLFAVSAQIQNADLQKDDSLMTPLSPQTTTRPDILWMRGGTGDVENTVYSPDGQMIAVSSVRQVKIMRASDGVLLQTINQTYNQIYKPFAFSPDSQTIAVANEVLQPSSHAIQIWRLSDKTMIRNIPISDPNNVGIINFSPDGTKIIAGYHIYNVSDGSVFFSTAESNTQSFFKYAPDLYSPNGQYIYGDSINPNTGATAVVRWNASNPTTPTQIDNSGNADSPVDISPNGQFIVTRNSYIVRTSDGSVIAQLAGYGHYVFSPNGQYVAGAFGAGIVRVNRTTDWGVVWSSPADQSATGSVSFSPDSQSLAVSTLNIRLLNASNGSLIRNLTTLKYAPVYSLAFSSDGQTLATATDNSLPANTFGTIQLWNVADGSRRSVNFTQSVGLRVFQIFITPDNQKLITLDTDSNSVNFYVRFWNANDGSLIRSVPQGSGFNSINLSLSADGQTYSTDFTRSFSDTEVNFYNASDDSLIRNMNGVGGGAGSAFSPNGQFFATNGDQFGVSVKLFNGSGGTLLRTLNLSGSHPGAFPNMVFSPDNQTIAVTERTGNSNVRTGIIELFRVSDGALLRTFGTFDNWAATVAFAPDGQTIIGTGQDATVRIWRVSDGALLQTYDKETYIQPSGGSAVLWQVAYSPDGSRFAYGRQDATVVMARNPYPTTPPTNYMISGNITRSGSALSGVTVALGGSTSGTTATDISGNYSFTVTDGGSYTVTPSSAGNAFAPASQSFNFISQNQTANFTASFVTHTISGNITRSGAALSGAAVNLSGSSTGSAMTDISGNYSFTVNEGGNYTVTPALAGNIFTPTNRNFSNVTTDQIGNFTALFSTYTISGNVKADGANLQGATVSLTGTQTQMTTTDANGNYTFTANTNGNYTVSVSKNGDVFAPASQIFNNLQANQTANFQNGAPLCAPAPSGLAAWYKGENNGFDSSGNGNTLEITNGLTFAPGKVGQAFSFDGINDYATTPTSNNSHPTSAITLDVWAKPSELKLQTLISKYSIGSSTANRNFLLDTDASGTRVIFTVYQSPDAAVAKKYQTTNAVLSLNVMTHIAATFDTATQQMHIYINGADVPTTQLVEGTVTAINDPNVQLRLGTLRDINGSDVELFHGLLDEVQIYNRALSATEIQNIHNSGSTGVCQLTNFSGAGLLDTTFNGTGKVTTPIGIDEDAIYAVALQPDGKIVAAGRSIVSNKYLFALARYNADGTLDTSFGTGGKLTTSIGGRDDEANAVAIQSDGKILAAGIEPVCN